MADKKQNSEQKRQYILDRIQEMCYFDDDFMTKCFEDYKEGIELVLRIIMNDNELVVEKARTQAGIKNLQGRSIRMDVTAVDRVAKQYDVETQRAPSGAKPKRARYNSSIMDANAILPGDDTEYLPETYVIFITESDVLQRNLPIYHIDRRIEETGELFGDDAHIIYVNGQIKDNTPLGKLMHDFSCTNPEDMNYKELADRARYFKTDKEGQRSMCKIVEDIVAKEMKEERIEFAKNLLNNGKLTLEEIAQCSGLTVEEVKAVKVLQPA